MNCYCEAIASCTQARHVRASLRRRVRRRAAAPLFVDAATAHSQTVGAYPVDACPGGADTAGDGGGAGLGGAERHARHERRRRPGAAPVLCF